MKDIIKKISNVFSRPDNCPFSSIKLQCVLIFFVTSRLTKETQNFRQKVSTRNRVQKYHFYTVVTCVLNLSYQHYKLVPFLHISQL